MRQRFIFIFVSICSILSVCLEMFCFSVPCAHYQAVVELTKEWTISLTWTDDEFRSGFLSLGNLPVWNVKLTRLAPDWVQLGLATVCHWILPGIRPGILPLSGHDPRGICLRTHLRTGQRNDDQRTQIQRALRSSARWLYGLRQLSEVFFKRV